MVNKTVLQGRLTADVELIRTSSDVPFCSFTLAWSEKYKEAETKCFLRCKAWRHTAEFISKYFFKGKEAVVEGKLTTEEWTDKNDGSRKSCNVLIVDQMHFCGSKSDDKSHVPASSSVDPNVEFEEVDLSEDDLPF